MNKFILQKPLKFINLRSASLTFVLLLSLVFLGTFNTSTITKQANEGKVLGVSNGIVKKSNYIETVSAPTRNETNTGWNRSCLKYPFTVKKSGDYKVTALVKSNDDTSDSFIFYLLGKKKGTEKFTVKRWRRWVFSKTTEVVWVNADDTRGVKLRDNSKNLVKTYQHKYWNRVSDDLFKYWEGKGQNKLMFGDLDKDYKYELRICNDEKGAKLGWWKLDFKEDKVTPKKVDSENVTSQKATPKEVTPENVTSQKTTPKEVVTSPVTTVVPKKGIGSPNSKKVDPAKVISKKRPSKIVVTPPVTTGITKKDFGSPKSMNDLSCLSWNSFVSNSNLNLTDHSAVVIDNYAYVFGGKDHNNLNFATKHFTRVNLDNSSDIVDLTQTGGPTARYGHSSVVIGRDIYILGGHTRSDVWRYNVDSAVWTNLGNMSAPRQDHKSVVHDGKIYSFLGSFSGGAPVNTYEITSLSGFSSVSHTLASSYLKKDYALMFDKGSQIVYLYAGNGGTHSTNDIYKFAFDSNGLVTPLTFPFSQNAFGNPREGVVGWYANGNLFAIGGFSTGLSGDPRVLSGVDNSLDVFNLRFRKDSRYTPLDRPVAYAELVRYKNKTYLIGGVDNNSNGIAGIYVYDPEKEPWTAHVDSLSYPYESTLDKSTVLVGNELYIYTGNAGGKFSVYNLYTKTETTLNMPKDTNGTDIVLNNPALVYNTTVNALYLIGGADSSSGSKTTTFMTYSLSTGQEGWNNLGDNVLPNARGARPGVAVTEDKVYIYGGIDATPVNLIDIYDYNSNSWASDTGNFPIFDKGIYGAGRYVNDTGGSAVYFHGLSLDSESGMEIESMATYDPTKTVAKWGNYTSTLSSNIFTSYSMVTDGDKIHFFKPFASQGGRSNELYIFDIGLNSWTTDEIAYPYTTGGKYDNSVSDTYTYSDSESLLYKLGGKFVYYKLTATDSSGGGIIRVVKNGVVDTYKFSCSVTNPVADFTADDVSIGIYNSVQFVDLSTGYPSTWDWDFGDGTHSDIQNPSHQYSTGGTYTVTLTVTNSAGNSVKTKTNYITVTDVAPVADFSGVPTTLNINNSVQFTDLSTNNPTTWDWDFGDGRISSVQNPSHQYDTAGTYTVTLTVRNTTGSDTKTKVSYITVNDAAPVADFTATPTTVNANGYVQFNDTSSNNPTSWNWDFGDGTTSSYFHPYHQYTAPGIYTVTLTVTNGVGSDTKTRVNYITVTNLAPIADFVGDPRTIITNQSVRFTDLSANNPTSWDWDLGDGTTSSEVGPYHQYTSAGVYTITLTVTNGAGSDTKTIVDYITVNDEVVVPVADFTGTPRYALINDTVQFTDLSVNEPTNWSWNFGDGTISSLQNPSHQYLGAVAFPVSLTATNSAGSDTENKDRYIIVSHPTDIPVADFTGTPTTIVANDSVQFTATSAYPVNYDWDFGDGEVLSGALSTPLHQYAVPGTYTVTLTVTNGAGSDTKTIVDYITVTDSTIAPVADFTGTPTAITTNQSVQFTDSSTNNPTSWDWDFGDGSVHSGLQNPPHQYTSAGTYTVSLTVTNGAGSDTKIRTNYVTVADGVVSPIADFTGTPTTIRTNESVEFTDLSVNEPTTWSWNFGDGEGSTDQNPVHTYTTPGVYTVRLYVTNSAGSNIEIKNQYITVEDFVNVVDFVADKTSGYQPLSVQFTDTSVLDPSFNDADLSYTWSFGDGQTSNEKNPVHTYNTVPISATEKFYTVSLEINTPKGMILETKVDYINLKAHIVANFTINQLDNDVPASVVFNPVLEHAPNHVNYSWSFGDLKLSNEKNPTHIYRSPGTYSPSLRVTSSNGEDFISRKDLIKVYSNSTDNFKVDFTASPSTGARPLTVYFTNTSPVLDGYGWFWTFGDNEDNPQLGAPVAGINTKHIYYKSGTYNVKLSAIGKGGQHTKVKQIVVTEPSGHAPVADFIVKKESNNMLSFIDKSTYLVTSWNWDFGDGTTSDLKDPKHLYSSEGIYTVKLRVTNAYGSSIKKKMIHVTFSNPVRPPTRNFFKKIGDIFLRR